jgi:hypothetical protein
MKFVGLIVIAIFVSGCSTKFEQNREFERKDFPLLFSSLDKEKDGFSSIASTGENFEIISTHRNDNKLCRLVKLKSPDLIYMETFCKIKGGEWR